MPGEDDQLGGAEARDGDRDGRESGTRRYWCRLEHGSRQVLFDAEESRHLRRVMRLRGGDRIEAIDGSGRVFEVELAPGRGRTARGRILATHPAAPPPERELWLGQALIRPARFELLVEKAVELGVAGIVPLVTRHAHPARQLTPARMERLLRIARSAVAQSLGCRLPIIDPPTPLPELDRQRFDWIAVAHGPGPTAGPPAPPARGRLLCLIRPEGGFDPAEIADLQAGGATLITLGERRLRAETAAIVALALLGHHPVPASGRR
jgi:16S rRNA (uracil1498-N3)-methyltransferase